MSEKLWKLAWTHTHTPTGTKGIYVWHTIVRDDVVAIGQPDAAAVGNAYAGAYKDELALVTDSQWRIDYLTVTEVLPPGSTSIPSVAIHNINQVCTNVSTGDRLPLALTTLVTLKTNAAVRSGHGRIHLLNPGDAGLLNASGAYDSSTPYWISNIPFLMTNLAADQNVSNGSSPHSTGHLVVYSRKRHANPATPQYFFDVVAAIPHQEPHWLRSRMTAP